MCTQTEEKELIRTLSQRNELIGGLIRSVVPREGDVLFVDQSFIDKCVEVSEPLRYLPRVYVAAVLGHLLSGVIGRIKAEAEKNAARPVGSEKPN